MGTHSARRPVIAVRDGTIGEQIRAVARVLADHPRIFVRAGELVRVVEADDGFATIQAASSDLEEIVSDACAFVHAKGNPIDAPDRLVACLRRRTWTGREILGVTRTPMMRPDGTVLERKGYDPATRLWFAPLSSEIFQPVAAAPSKAEASAALAYIVSYVVETPFVNETHRSAWLAAALTPFARPMINGSVPIAAFSASDQKNGKTELAKTIESAVTGADAEIQNGEAYSANELRKRLLPIVEEGRPVVAMDNISGTLGCAALDSLATSKVWRDRVLGHSRLGGGAVRTFLIFTGNRMRITAGADTARRILWARLERPPGHAFKNGDPSARVLRERPRFVHAALTILRAYVVAGLPQPAGGLRKWDGFDEWSKVIRGALVWLGKTDPYDTEADMALHADGARAAVTRILEALLRVFGAGGFTTAMIRRQLEGPNLSRDEEWLLEELVTRVGGDGRGQPDATKLGQWLSREMGRHADLNLTNGEVLGEARKGTGGGTRWRILRTTVPAAPSGGEVGEVVRLPPCAGRDAIDLGPTDGGMS